MRRIDSGNTHILIMRPGAIGDSLLTFPILKALKTQYPGSSITFVSNGQVLPLALVAGLVEEVSDYQDIQWSELFSTTGVQTSSLKETLQHTDLAICWLRDPDGVVEDNLLKAGVQRVIVTPGRPPEDERMHIVDYLAKTIGLENVEGEGDGKGDRKGRPYYIRVENASLGAQDSYGQYIAIHPGSGGSEKCWPAAKFAAVIERLRQLHRPVLLLSGPADSERVQALLSSSGSAPDPKMLKVLDNLPLIEVAQYLQQCVCYLGNDSGITHLAALLGVPTIALFGPSDPIVWRPIGPKVKIIQEDVLEQLSVDVVMEELSSFYKLSTSG